MALLAGVAIPLLVQLFLTARSVQRVAASAEGKLEDVRHELHELLAGARREPGPSDWSAVLASAAVPAVIAAVRTFRSSVAPSGQTSRQQQSTTGGCIMRDRDTNIGYRGARVPLALRKATEAAREAFTRTLDSEGKAA